MPGAPPSASTNRPVSSLTAGRPLAAQMADALSVALPISVSASSTTSGTSAGRGSRSTTPRRIASISTTLSGFADGQTSWSRGISRTEGARCRRDGDHLYLQRDDFVEPALGQPQERVELAAGERRSLGGALDFDEQGLRAFPRQHDDVHVDLRGRILRVGKVEHRYSPDYADADRCAERVQRMLRDCLGLHETRQRVVQREVAAADAGGTRPAVGLQHIAVDHDLTLAERTHVARGAQRPADEALYLDGSATLLSLGGFAIDALRRRAGQHRILAGDPALAGVLHPSRHVLVDRRRAQHTRLAERHEDTPGGHLRVVTLEADRAQFVVGAAVGSSHG